MSEPKETTNDTKIAQILLNQQHLIDRMKAEINALDGIISQLNEEIRILKKEVEFIKDQSDPRHHER